MSLESLIRPMEEVLTYHDVYSKEDEQDGLHLFSIETDERVASFVSDNKGLVEIIRPQQPSVYSVGTTTTIILKLSNEDIKVLYSVVVRGLLYQQM